MMMRSPLLLHCRSGFLAALIGLAACSGSGSGTSSMDSIIEIEPDSSIGPFPRTSAAWADARAAYRPVLVQLLANHPLNDSLFGGRVATVCLGTPAPQGTEFRDTAALGLLARAGRDVVPIEHCASYSGLTEPGAPPPRFTPAAGAPAPIYVDPRLEAWMTDAVRLRVNVVRGHGVTAYACTATRGAGKWTASCRFDSAHIF